MKTNSKVNYKGAGRKPIPLYLYDSEGSKIRKYKCRNEFIADYFPDRKSTRGGPIPWKIEQGTKYYKTCKGDYVFEKAVGRKCVIDINRIENSPLCVARYHSKTPISLKNARGECVGVFKNMKYLAALLNSNIPPSIVNRKYRKGSQASEIFIETVTTSTPLSDIFNK